jgi:hypothetical protein
MSALDELNKLLKESHLHKLKPEPEPVKPKVSAADISEFKKLLSITTEQSNAIQQLDMNSQELIEKEIAPAIDSIKALAERLAPRKVYEQKDSLNPLNQKFVTLDQFNKHYSDFLVKIQTQLSTLGGGGEVNLRYLDDVARETIDDGLFLKYNGTSRKFEFANVNANALIPNTTYVTTSEYTVQDDDYYLGVDYAGPTTIILPVSDTNGRCIVIKDEDGDAETNPITVQGTVDNDAGGFILQINNGSIQLIYRNGWRII